jgi:cell wall-associated NlpC family hydrolase
LLEHARARLRAGVLTSTALTATSVLVVALLATGTAHAEPATAPSTTVTTTTTTAPTAVPTAAQKKAAKQARKAARIKARKAARAAHERSVRTRVVKLAKSKVGHARYVAGAAGPNSFDCSGLALYVWRKAAGKSLPHYSRAQAAVTKNVSRRNLKRGDLVFFFGSGAHHVAIYIGHGRMVGAANPSSGIRIDRVWSGWYGQRYSGAGRLFRH